MKRVVMVGDDSIREALKTVATNIQGSTTMYKNTETGELSTEIPTNTMFEITNFKSEEIKSGREKRRIKRQAQRRKQQRINK